MKIKELLFTGFYSGYVPVAPGTAGSVVGMALYFIEYLIFGQLHWSVNLIAVLILLYPSGKICGYGEIFFGKKDPGPVVWDEIIGYWVSMLLLPFNWKTALAGFCIFRIMDIVKPFPAYNLQKLKGGLGILIDDVIAGIYTCIVLHLGVFLLAHYGINIL